MHIVTGQSIRSGAQHLLELCQRGVIPQVIQAGAVECVAAIAVIPVDVFFRQIPGACSPTSSIRARGRSCSRAPTRSAQVSSGAPTPRLSKTTPAICRDRI